MERYDVIIETTAYDDLNEILSYIAYALKEPTTAQRIYSSIKKSIQTLEYMPHRHAIIDEERYIERGIRKLFVENYIAFYSVDESTLTVHVLRILYNRRNWQYLI